jgi:sporulation protein YlmC with PRC-barrel domain
MAVISDQIRDRHQNDLLAKKDARYLLLSQIINKKVQTQTGTGIGKLKDFVFKDDPHYAEVTDLVIERSRSTSV